MGYSIVTLSKKSLLTSFRNSKFYLEEKSDTVITRVELVVKAEVQARLKISNTSVKRYRMAVKLRNKKELVLELV